MALGGFGENMANNASTRFAAAGNVCSVRFLPFCYKAGIAAGALFGSYLLHRSGVRGEPDAAASVVEMAPGVISNVRLAYLLPPALCYFGAALFMICYPLSRARMREIRGELDARHSTARKF